MDRDLDQLAKEHGISLTRPSPENVEVPITDSVKRKVLAALGVAVDSEPQKPVRKSPENNKIAPSFLPHFLEADRVWGISLQLYELRSERNWGIGDFEDLVEMVRFAATLGADFVGLNPLHAPFLADPDRCSPYEPSNRQMLNPLYIAVDKITSFESTSELEARLQELRSTDLVDYIQVAETKLAVLREVWASWRRLSDNSSRQNFEAFVANGGEILRRHALFEALSAFMGEKGSGTGWKSWPAAYQQPESAEVAAFADEHADTIDFHIWLQWLCNQQLIRVAETARDAGLRIGLYLDLAVGEAIDGSATWSEPDAYIADATVGSPPDPFAPNGQDWHLAAFHPAKIVSGDDAPYRRMVTAAMRYAGAIRIDHAAALRRLFLVPLESLPEGGAYVDYPQNGLLQILAEASSKFRCLVIGEDLGMLPDGLQKDLAEAQILSYRILSYEREEEGFKPTEAYPRLSLACISTHDHQTLAGWWRGADIKARLDHGVVPPDLTEAHVKERQHEREDLKVALEEAGTDPPNRLPSSAAGEHKLNDLIVSAHRFIAKTASMLAGVRLADMTGEKRPTNIPGTSDSYPNWKPKLSVAIEQLASVSLLLRIAEAVREERPNQR
ncbi:4-alpha-glucanotransferase [Rhizobium sp. XQZ8]|uniref:4-alpha-glucanotransferase n=1 Tax=Rhizobium populisoli TaxID=2859785 RepID=UPI001CA53370|nr:4-alpha-glucanotransferase [Rhizobium populisoli]MBW6425365.1 4-alpha-glucanotransferase [Rhizobium populisoli]